MALIQVLVEGGTAWKKALLKTVGLPSSLAGYQYMGKQIFQAGAQHMYVLGVVSMIFLLEKHLTINFALTPTNFLQLDMLALYTYLG